MKPHQKVQIQSNKKLDKMFGLLIEQNAEVQKQISNYRNKYAKAAAVIAEENKAFLDSVADQNLRMSGQHRASARSPAGMSASKN